MKSKQWIFGIWMTVLSFHFSPLSAQHSTRKNIRKPERIAISPQNVLKINPLSLFTLTTSVFYERIINEQMSGQLGFFYTFPGVTIAHTSYRGFGLTPEFRYYVFSEAPNGFYVGPFLRYQRFTLKYQEDGNQFDGQSGTFTAFGGGGLLGYQWVFGKRVSLDAFFGLAVSGFSIKADIPEVEEKFRLPIPGTILPRIGLTLGVAL
jgi:hypothetical protein